MYPIIPDLFTSYGVPFTSPGDLPDPGIKPTSFVSNLHWQVCSLPLAPSGKPPLAHSLLYLMCLHSIVSHNLSSQYVENASMPERGNLFLKTKHKFTNSFSCNRSPWKNIMALDTLAKS